MAAIYRPQRIASVAVYRAHRGTAVSPPAPSPAPAPNNWPARPTGQFLPIAFTVSTTGQVTLVM